MTINPISAYTLPDINFPSNCKSNIECNWQIFYNAAGTQSAECILDLQPCTARSKCDAPRINSLSLRFATRTLWAYEKRPGAALALFWLFLASAIPSTEWRGTMAEAAAGRHPARAIIQSEWTVDSCDDWLVVAISFKGQPLLHYAWNVTTYSSLRPLSLYIWVRVTYNMHSPRFAELEHCECVRRKWFLNLLPWKMNNRYCVGLGLISPCGGIIFCNGKCRTNAKVTSGVGFIWISQQHGTNSIKSNVNRSSGSLSLAKRANVL